MSQAPTVLRCSVCQREYPAATTACPEHGATLTEVDALIERIISRRYRLVRCVGRGGMGAVYEGRHIHTDQRVAVKVLAPHLSRDLKLVARFRREAMATSRLRHENCVQVHDFGEDDDGTFFIAMELVDGRGIGDEIRRTGPVSASRVARIGVQLLGALEAAHGAGILHRDLKPQNIMLTQKVGRPDFVKVVDFGIAKFVENSPEDQVALTLPGTIFGTPEYMSPEQARGEPLDGRSDIYSSAVVLWHMLLGRSPYRGKTVRETLMKVFRENPPRASEERPDAELPRALEDALLVALEKEPRDRYPDATAFRRALSAFTADRPRTVPEGVLPGTSSDGGAPPATVGMTQPAPTSVEPGTRRSGTLIAPMPPVSDASPQRPIQASPTEPETTARTEPTVPYEPPAPPESELSTEPVDALPSPDAPTAPLDAASDGPSDTALVAASESAPERSDGNDPDTLVAATESRRERPRERRPAPRPASFSLLTLLLLVVGGGAIGGLGLGAVAFGIYRAISDASASEGDQAGADDDNADPRADDRQQQAASSGDGGWLPLEGFPHDDAPSRAPEEALRAASMALAGEDLDAADAAYQEALRGDPSSAAARQGLAMVAYRRGDLARAKDHLEQLMQLDARYAAQFRGFHAIVTKQLRSRLQSEQR